MNLYISWLDWQKATTGLEWKSIIGNAGRINSSVASGSVSIPTVLPLTVEINKYDPITIFDGSNSEIVTATTLASIGDTSISVSPTSFSHASGVPYCTDGLLGSLSSQIVSASQWLETICHQPLFLSAYTNEELAMPSMRAAIDNAYALHFRPRHWPVQTISNLSISCVPNVIVQYDPAQVVIDSDRQICTMPNMQPLPVNDSGQPAYPIWNVQKRNSEAQLTLTYTSGYSSLPNDITEAAILLVSDILSKRQNPTGSPELRSGSRMLISTIRIDKSGESLLFKKAKKILDNYTVQSF